MAKKKTETKTEAEVTPVAATRVAPMTATPALKSVSSSKPKKMNATQKLLALEELVASLNGKIDVMADEIEKLSTFIKSITKRLNASIKVADSDNDVKKIIIKENIKELEGKVTFLEQQGVLIKNDEALITDPTFVVAREVDDDGNEVNPRVQFAVGSLDPSYKKNLIGKKLGDLVKPEGDTFTLEIMEIYNIVNAANRTKKNPDGVGAKAAQ